MPNNENLDIEQSPDHLAKVDGASDVKKLNKNPLIIISVVVVILILALLYAAASRNEAPKGQESSTPTSQAPSQSSDEGAKLLNELDTHSAQDPLSNPSAYGSIPPDPLAQSLPPAQGASNNGIPPSPTNYNGNLGAPPPMNMRTQAREEFIMQRLKYAQKALDVPSKVELSTQNPSLGATGSNTIVAAPKEPSIMEKYMAQLSGKAPTDESTPNDDKNRKFLAESISYDYLPAQKAAQQTPFEIKTGTVIPGVMITGMNSDLPGKIKAQVSENVYDSASGHYLLIPQGTTIVGDYSSNIVYGQSRVLVAWNRLVFPDGKTLNIGNMNGIDKAGYSGFQDQVDNHYFRIFGSAFLMSSITAGIAVSSQNNGSQLAQTPSDQVMASMIQQMGQVGTQMIQKNLNIAPTLMIRPGYKFNIFITKDLKLEPLKLKLR